MKDLFQRMKVDLRQFRPDGFKGGDMVNYRSAVELAEATLESYRFPSAIPASAGPCRTRSPSSPGTTAASSFLASQHTVASAEDAEAYLDRLAAFGPSLDQESERVRRRFALGATPPDFVLKTTSVQFEAMLGAPARPVGAGDQPDPANRREGHPRRLGGRAAGIVCRPGPPRHAPPARAAAEGPCPGPHTTPAAGGCRRRGATTVSACVPSPRPTWTARKSHRLGREIVARLSADAEAILIKRGLTQGTVGQLSPRCGPAQPALSEHRRRPRRDPEGHERHGGGHARARCRPISAPAPGPVETSGSALDRGRRARRILPAAVPRRLAPGDLLHQPARNTAGRRASDLPTWCTVGPTRPPSAERAGLEAKDLPLIRKMPLFSAGFSEGLGPLCRRLADEMGAYERRAGPPRYLASLLFQGR